VLSNRAASINHQPGILSPNNTHVHRILTSTQIELLAQPSISPRTHSSQSTSSTSRDLSCDDQPSALPLGQSSSTDTKSTVSPSNSTLTQAFRTALEVVDNYASKKLGLTESKVDTVINIGYDYLLGTGHGRKILVEQNLVPTEDKVDLPNSLVFRTLYRVSRLFGAIGKNQELVEKAQRQHAAAVRIRNRRLKKERFRRGAGLKKVRKLCQEALEFAGEGFINTHKGHIFPDGTGLLAV